MATADAPSSKSRSARDFVQHVSSLVDAGLLDHRDRAVLVHLIVAQDQDALAVCTASQVVDNEADPDAYAAAVQALRDCVQRKLASLSQEQKNAPPFAAFPSEDDLPPPQLKLMRHLSALRQQGHVTQAERSALKSIALKDERSAQTLAAAAAAAPGGASQDELKALAAAHLCTEQACREIQQEEMEALRHIFADELTVSECVPVCLNICPSLANLDWFLDLNFMLPATYPLLEPIRVTAFISRSTLEGRLNDLLAMLRTEAANRAGEPAIFALVQAAVDWINGLAAEDTASDRWTPADSVDTQDDVKVSRRKRGTVEDSLSTLIKPLPAHLRRGAMMGMRKILGIQLASMTQIYRAQRLSIKQVQQALQCSAGRAKALLRANMWNAESAITQGKALPAGAAIIAGRHASRTPSGSAVPSKNKSTDPTSSGLDHDFRCITCMETFGKRFGAGTACGHWMCYSCWSGYLSSRVSDGSGFILCPGEKCGQFLDEELIQALLPADVYARYSSWVTGSFLDLGCWKYCTNLECGRVARPVDPQMVPYPTIPCFCGVIWCYGCQQPGHWPTSCTEMKTLQSIAGDTNIADIKKALAVEKVDVDLLPCPHCNTMYDKISGCNYMACNKCGHAFCWECGGKWAPVHSDHFRCPGKRLADRSFTFVNSAQLPDEVTVVVYGTVADMVAIASLTGPTLAKVQTAAQLTEWAARAGVKENTLQRAVQLMLEITYLLMQCKPLALFQPQALSAIRQAISPCQSGAALLRTMLNSSVAWSNSIEAQVASSEKLLHSAVLALQTIRASFSQFDSTWKDVLISQHAKVVKMVVGPNAVV